MSRRALLAVIAMIAGVACVGHGAGAVYLTLAMLGVSHIMHVARIAFSWAIAL